MDMVQEKRYTSCQLSVYAHRETWNKLKGTPYNFHNTSCSVFYLTHIMLPFFFGAIQIY